MQAIGGAFLATVAVLRFDSEAPEPGLSDDIRPTDLLAIGGWSCSGLPSSEARSANGDKRSPAPALVQAIGYSTAGSDLAPARTGPLHSLSRILEEYINHRDQEYAYQACRQHTPEDRGATARRLIWAAPVAMTTATARSAPGC